MSDEKFEVKESDMDEAEQAVVIGVVREAQRLYNIDKGKDDKHPVSTLSETIQPADFWVDLSCRS